MRERNDEIGDLIWLLENLAHGLVDDDDIEDSDAKVPLYGPLLAAIIAALSRAPPKSLVGTITGKVRVSGPVLAAIIAGLITPLGLIPVTNLRVAPMTMCRERMLGAGSKRVLTGESPSEPLGSLVARQEPSPARGA
jgi:hypothetical protein